MKITNQTHYSTRHLRKIFIACEKNEGTDYQNRLVEVRYSRGSVSGYAYYNSHQVVMKLPKTRKDRSNQASIHQVARVYIHEVGHNLNLKHKDMTAWWNIKIDFLESGKVDLKNTPVKKPAVIVREENVRKKLSEWEKKLKRAEIAIKKYKTKVRYYDKKKEKALS